MGFQRVTRSSAPDQVFEQILSDVVSGGLAAGQTLPSERRLAEVLGVSRPTVREALQRVAQAGLVEVRQGDSTSVRDYRRHAGLSLLPHLLVRKGNLDLSVVRSILEARLAVGPAVAALAAERTGGRLTQPLAQEIDGILSDPDPVGRQRHALTFWDLIVDGAESIAFRLMFNGFRAAYEPALPALTVVLDSDAGRVDAYRALAAAISSADPPAARQAAEDLLAPMTELFITLIHSLGDTP